MEDPVVPLERNWYGHLLPRLLWERQFEEVLFELGWEKCRTGTVFLFTGNKDYSCRCTWTTSKLLERSRIWHPCGKLMKNVDLDEPSSFFRSRILGDVLNVNVNQKKPLLKNTQRCLNHVFLLKQQKNYLGRKNLTQKQLHGPMMCEGHAKKSMWKDTAEWQRRKMSNCRKFQVIAWMDIMLRRRNLNQWRIIISDFIKLCWNACTWHELGRPGSCSYQMDSRMWQTTQNLFHTLIIHKTTDNIAMWVIRHSTVHWPCSRIQTLLVILEDSKSTSGGILCFWKSNIRPCTLECVKSKLQHLTAPLNLKLFLLMLDFRWMVFLRQIFGTLVVQVLRSLQINKKPSIIASGNGSEISQVHQSNKREHPLAAGNGSVCNVDQVSQMDHVSSKAQYSQGDSKLYIFEDNEAVIKMIIKGRSLPWDMWQEPTELLLIVRSNQFWSEDPNSDTLTPRIKSLTF